MFADAHCHLDSFESPGEVIERARSAGISLIVSNSVDLETMEKNLALASRFPEVEAALGVHPSNALSMGREEIERALSFLKANANKIAAVGETGLDFKHASSAAEKEIQRGLFLRHISLASEYGKPVIVHSRMARRECIEILREQSAEKVLLHWFLCGEKTLSEVIGRKWFYSIGPSVLENAAVQKFAAAVPLEFLVLETDAPVRFSGRTSEPAWIPRVAKKIAELKGVPPEEVASITTENAFSLLGVQQKG